MFFKKLLLVIIFFACIFSLNAHCQQTIKDFYLSNYKEDGVREWELKGDEAVVHDRYVDIDKMEATYFSADDPIKIKSKRAKLDKENMDVYLEKDVEVKNEEGMKLTTDSLDWQRNNNLIETEDWVQAEKESMQIKAKGLSADTQFKNVDFQKDVQVTFPGQDNQEIITVNCVGPLEIQYNDGTATFYNNVVMEKKEGKLFSDKSTIFFDGANKKITKIVSEGNVKIIRDDNITFAQKATYWGQDQRLTLEGNPRLVYLYREKE